MYCLDERSKTAGNNALPKVIADNSVGIIFNMLNLFDGTSSPKHLYNEWTGVKLIDEESNENESEFKDTLHDSFF